MAGGMEVTLAPSLLNADGSIKVGQAHGAMTAAAREGRLLHGVSASGGIALIVPAAAGGHPTLINPRGSGVVAAVRRLTLSWVSGANAPGAVEWALTNPAGAQAATGASSPILTATAVALTNAVTGGPVKTKLIWSPTTNTFTAAPVFHRPAGISLFTGISTTAVAPFTLDMRYDDFFVGDDTAISLCFQTTTTTALFQVLGVVEEIKG